VLVGPPDRGQLVKTSEARDKPADLYRWSTVHGKIARIQADVAARFQCSFWDWRRAMGGEGAAYRWFYHDPRWMARDLIHLTAAGYRESGRLLAAYVRPAD
jgi:hypothetical protein